MKYYITICLLITLLFSFACKKGNEVNDDTIITLEEALDRQMVSFDWGERNIHVTDSGINNKSIMWINAYNIMLDTTTETIITKQVSFPFPEEQTLEGQFEGFQLEFNKVASINEIDKEKNSFISDTQFETNFLTLGSQDAAKIGIQQTFTVVIGDQGKTTIKVDTIKKISNKDGAIFITGTFESETSIHDIKIESGVFQIILEN